MDFHLYCDLSIEPKHYEIIWLIFQHSFPCKARLWARGHPDVLEPCCPHHPSPDFSLETISHVVFCSTSRPVWRWTFHLISLISGQPLIIQDRALEEAPEERLMYNFLSSVWMSRAPPELQELWREILALTIYHIVHRRNCLSIDEIARDTEESARAHCAHIRNQIIYSLRSILRSKVWALNAFARSIHDAKSHQSFTKKALNFQKVYCSNSVLGSIELSSNPTQCKLSSTDISILTNLPNFKNNNQFFLDRLRGEGRRRGPAAIPSFAPSAGRRPYDPGVS